MVLSDNFSNRKHGSSSPLARGGSVTTLGCVSTASVFAMDRELWGVEYTFCYVKTTSFCALKGHWE